MVVAKFSDNFWGEKLNGFDILCQNLKHSLNNVKELETYLRECSSIEDAYTKLISKLAMQTNKYSLNGTFYPLWSPIKELNDRLNTTHSHKMQQINDIIKEIQRYYDDLNKKIKKLRDNETQTQQCVQNFQDITQLLTKSKEAYHTIALEHEKQKRADNPNLQKLEKKLKQSLDEYKLNIDKYNGIRNDYERKLNDSFQNFQLSEEIHLKQMRVFIDNYGKLLINNNQVVTQVYQEFYAKIDSLNNEHLVQLFIDNKRTGSERPEAVYLIEPDFSKLPQHQQQQHNQQQNVVQQINDLDITLNDTQQYQSLNSSTSVNPLSLSSSTSSSNNTDTQLNSSPQIQQSHHFSLGSMSSSTMQTTSATNISLPTTTATTAITSINSNAATTTTATNNSTSSVLNMKRSDSKGFNIFNVDILSRKSKATKASKANATNTTAKTKKKNSLDSSQAQAAQSLQQQQKSLTPDHSFIQAPQLDLIQINYSNKDDLLFNDSQNTTNDNTGRTINSVLGSSALDLFDTLKTTNSTNGSDIDSEGYSIRPDKMIQKSGVNKDTDDLNNFYNSSSGSGSDSDSEPEPGMGPTKVIVNIKPKDECEVNLNEKNTDLLREIGKNLQLKQTQLPMPASKVASKRTGYNYNFEQTSAVAMSRSISFGGVSSTAPTMTTADLNMSVRPLGTNESGLYNIDEDREVESSLQTINSNSYPISSTTPIQSNASTTTTPIQSAIPPPLPPPPPSATINSALANSIPGRFTPACFPGRTTPDFHYTTSFFENSTRAITSPLTLNDNANIIPIAIAFNETIHAYFKLAEQTKHKIKCFGCMKISFPFAILKFLMHNDLPVLEFRLNNLQLHTPDDLIINKQLLLLSNNNNNSGLPVGTQYQFNTVNLIKELKEQHLSNKQAAFFNFELLKYEFKYTEEPPLFLNSKWSYVHLNETQIELTFNLDFQLNYKKSHLTNVNFMLALTQQLSKFKLSVQASEPQAQIQINEDKLQILWQFLNLNKSGSLSLRLHMNVIDLDGSTSKNELITYLCEQPLYVKFHADNQTLSNVKFDILSSNYKVSLLKEKIESGKYFCTPFINTGGSLSNSMIMVKSTTSSNVSTENDASSSLDIVTNGNQAKIDETVEDTNAESLFSC